MKITGSSTRMSARMNDHTWRLVSEKVVRAIKAVTRSSGAVGGDTAPVWQHMNRFALQGRMLMDNVGYAVVAKLFKQDCRTYLLYAIKSEAEIGIAELLGQD